MLIGVLGFRQRQRGKPVKTTVAVIGTVGILIGLLWIGQGTGYVRWPASSFMINESRWAWYGLATLVIGVVLIAWSSRRA
jgi:hypothetical protein